MFLKNNDDKLQIHYFIKKKKYSQSLLFFF
jgi:hypothetical protein